MDLKMLGNMPAWEWPGDAGETLTAVVDDAQADPSRRRAAVVLAGEVAVIGDGLANALLEVVGSRREPAELRAQAACSLGPALEHSDVIGFEDPDGHTLSKGVVDRIVKVLKETCLDTEVPDVVRRAILETSVCVPQPWHTEAVRAAYESRDGQWKRTAVCCMRDIRGFEGEILREVERQDKETLLDAVCAAGNWELDRAWQQVVDLAVSADTEKALRLAAIDAVVAIRPESAWSVLSELSDDDDDDVVDALHEALAMAGVSQI